MCDTLTIRPAAPSDADALSRLLSRSYRALLAADYAPALLTEALPYIGQARPALLGCGTYFLTQDSDGRLLAAGGWTDTSPHGRAARTGEAHIRHVAVDPDAVRQGHGQRLLGHILAHARHAGVTRVHCLSTLTAAGFYRAQGFETLAKVETRLVPGLYFPVVQMQRSLA
ncbi:GNAT family N-acetyltransferase [Pseudooceanicola sp. 502str34]|uniref:GNAT family N-acetyltransferase n=1 Tax=Maritimibacter alkaliphilus TaxID=404236 RepID=UPI001C94B4B8|nr:GNAT family N-acetyltransferase [Maritimibacter alkaliphilus]MBY6091264.1 GNAT family N-acetyltransferase [Maritimibacter alkaliphilus]